VCCNFCPSQDLSGHLLFACVHGLANGVNVILDKAPSINLNSPLSSTNEQGLTPLSWAVLHSNSSLCKLLVMRGAGLDVRDSYGRTALHWSILSGWLACTKTLLKLGADITITDNMVPYPPTPLNTLTKLIFIIGF